MLFFEEYSYNKLIEYMPLLKESPFLCNDFSLGSLLMWNRGTDTQFAVYNNTLIIRQMIGDEPAFSYPFGEDPDGAMAELIEYVNTNDLSLLLFGVPEDSLARIKLDTRYKSVHVNYDRRWSDYLYSFEEMESFAGKKFNGQRNHINRFKKNYGEPFFSPIRPEDYDDIRDFLLLYHEEHSGNEIEEHEYQKTYELLAHFEELGMYGIVLRVEGSVAGFTIGEMIGDMLIVHVEKALRAYEGAYPTLFNGFMKYMRSVLGDGIRLVNREDDSGDIGLRTSKNQYHPVMLLHKYIVRIDSPVDDRPELVFDGGVLNAIRDMDKANYYALCTDKDNNRYWGYDYEEDESITEVNEDVFYDSQEFDYSLGSSVNFAVRKCEDCELIGETIVYHFTSNGYAEIGGRIAKKWQGQGLGTKAFAATADFAERQLHVKTKARCYKENIPSYHMITSAGFHKVNEDNVFYYFER